MPKKDKDAFSHFLEKTYPKSSVHKLKQGKIPVKLFCGPEKNVLKRFFKASLVHQFGHYIRVTADNPLTCEICLQSVLKHHLKKGEKKKVDLSYPCGLPYGAGVEVISRGALKKLNDEPNITKRQQEHVTLFIHENPKLFQVQEITVEKKYYAPSLRVTVDTKEDFDRFVKRMKQNDGTKKVVGLREIIKMEKN